jgi:ketosteroid isomerase-like protein
MAVTTSEQVVREFHDRQRAFYTGGDAEPLRELLTDDVVWHVPGRNPIAGDHAGIDAVMDYFERRRALARATFKVHVREVASSGDVVFQLAGGTAELGGREVAWETVGVFRVSDGRIAEGRLVPFDQYLFDDLWSS